MGGGDDAHVAADRAIAADALERALLQDAQQLDLHLHRHVADFVEEQRAALGKLEAPDPRGERAGEGALLVAEQLAFEQVRRNGAAVDGHERGVCPRRQLVQVPGRQLLAGAGLAEDEHVGVEGRYLLDLPQHRAQRGGLSTGSMAQPRIRAINAYACGFDQSGTPSRVHHPKRTIFTVFYEAFALTL